MPLDRPGAQGVMASRGFQQMEMASCHVWIQDSRSEIMECATGRMIARIAF